jgi:endonuclease-3
VEKNVEKRPFDIDEVLRRVRDAVRPFPKAALFELAERGYSSPFEQLVACIISTRTRDETTIPVSLRLFAAARSAAGIAALPAQRIDRLISACTFHERKAVQIRQLARRAAEEFGGRLPCDTQLFRSFAGVGIKCANLVAGTACGQARVSVDVHVHRVANRWGYIRASTPEKSTAALEERLPEHYRVEINRLLVPFGKHVCTGVLPRCTACPVLEFCLQVGVGRHR